MNHNKQIEPSPIKLALGIVVLGLMSMMIVRGAGQSGEGEWMIVCVGTMLYVVGSLFFFLFSENALKFVLLSALGLPMALFGLLFSAKYLSADSLQDYAAYKMIIYTILVFYIVGTGVSLLIRTIYRMSKAT